MVGNYGAQKIEPEERHLVSTRPFSGNALGQDAVEGRDAVGGDDEQVVADAVDIAHLAAGHPLDARQVGGGNNVRHDLAGALYCARFE